MYMKNFIIVVLISFSSFLGSITYQELKQIKSAHAAMSISSLKARLNTEITSVMTITDAAQLDKIAGAIAKAVYDEITTNAVVTVTGVTVGIGTAPGTIE